MSYGYFCEKGKKPGEEQIAELLGNKFEVWDAVNSYLINIIKAKSAYKFYGKNYGWALGFTKNGRSIISLYPLQNDFTIQIILKKRHENDVIKAASNKDFEKIILETPEISEGKWIFFKYSLVNSIEVIKKIIEIRLTL